MKTIAKFWLLLMALNAFLACSEQEQEELDLSEAKILISPQIKSPIKDTAGDILLEEIEKRTGLHLGLTNNWDAKTTIALALAEEIELFGEEVPARGAKSAEELQKEGYRIFNENKGGKNTIWILGADARGILYGIGKLLRTAKMSNGNITIDSKIDFSEAPEYTLRGHQFGYRNTANSWDAWTVEQFDQHFREQVLFGANSFENIPFQEVNSSPHFKVDPQIMEVELSKICEKYDAEYWVWTPAPHDLKVTNAHQEGLEEQEAFFAKCPRLDGVFVPGGDPGENHPAQLIPYLNDLSARLHKYHPDAGIWVSLQGFNKEKVDYFFAYLEENNPDWLKGLVYGPSSPPIDLERERLPKKYLHRFYPDITHTVRCQYPVDNWDQAFALTLGREPCNPQPLMYTELFNRDSKFTDGFITYSDGSHDDVNKVLWSQLGVDPNNDPKEIVLEYTQFFFGPDVAEAAAQGIFALEENWDGPILKTIPLRKPWPYGKGWKIAIHICRAIGGGNNW
ncbi:glycoside hydrolase family 20 zincin-like fold domain-containing protein [Cyclobacterium qasimii]|nr:glycoside hydrolase family 20 zincin-like fold domain-containing protein [Cyclobacterium qasimii]